MSIRVTTLITVMLAAFVLLNVACRKAESEKRTTNLTFVVPEGFPEPVYDFTANPVTSEGFALGKALFHDNRLSKFRDVSCGSCHQQLAAYTTFDHDLGHGTNFQHTTRNVPAIFNTAWQREFGWDGEKQTLQEQVLACITAPEKMGETAADVIAKLDTSADYPLMFAAAFGKDEINQDKLASALSQFVVMIVSADSRYDKMKRGEARFNANEEAGYELFKSKCVSCHAEPLFTDFSYRSIGLPHRQFHEDAGRMLVTGNTADSLKFKVPPLRNVAITSYYAHDGRFAGVSEVLEHYSSGIDQSARPDPTLQNGIQLTDLERFYIQEFLYTLDDSSLVKDPDFR